MDQVCPESRSYLDPFCGSGTVLFEAVARNCTALGVEVNPAAWHLAVLAEFAGLAQEAKREVIQFIRSIAATFATEGDDLFQAEAQPVELLEAIQSAEHSSMLRRALAAVLILGMGDAREVSRKAICRGAFSVLSVLEELIAHHAIASCFLADARKIPIKNDTIEAVITSPPYINVFNYHQNYRPAVELLGWKPLEAARSEIGSNRKHRMNRFLTVVQYCMDMCQSLDEAARVLKTGAPLVVVLGRTSNVLGASFENGSLIGEILRLSGSFDEVTVDERVFTNRFGVAIYEDILIARRAKFVETSLADARAVGVASLRSALRNVSDKSRSALESAIEQAQDIELSPLLSLSLPSAFSAGSGELEWKSLDRRLTATN
jgi:hypothetical protein